MCNEHIFTGWTEITGNQIDNIQSEKKVVLSADKQSERVKWWFNKFMITAYYENKIIPDSDKGRWAWFGGAINVNRSDSVSVI